MLVERFPLERVHEAYQLLHDGKINGLRGQHDKTNETTAIPVLLERLAENDGLKGALVSIDAEAVRSHWAIENSSLGARRHLRRRSIPRAQGTRSNKYGCRQTLRHQSRPCRQRQTKHKLRRKRAGWDLQYLAAILGYLPR